MLKILIVEDHILVREGMVRVLKQLDKEVEVLEAGDCDAGKNAIEEADDLDLVVLDLALPGGDGFSCLEFFRSRYPAVPVVIVSAFDDPPTVNRVLAHGASGFIPKAYSGEAILRALQFVLDGEIYRPRESMAVTLDDAKPVFASEGGVVPGDCGLTDRQSQVLKLMVKGKSNRDIATQLGLSEGTVKIHVTAVFKALGVSSRTQALVAASRYGIRF
jgi:DNA-binding NarL/FixJ family response regulator